MIKRLILVAAIVASTVFSIVGCGNPSPATLDQPIKIDLTRPEISDSSKGVIAKYWPAVVEACPGLRKYAADITFDGLGESNTFVLGSGVKPWSQVVIQISEKPSMPWEYHGNGNRCFFQISNDGSEAAIAKTACASVCLDRVVKSEEMQDGSLVLKLGRKEHP